MQRIIDLDAVTTKAVQAALAVVDEAMAGTTKKTAGPCGDELAYGIHRLIEAAILEHMESDQAPAGVSVAHSV